MCAAREDLSVNAASATNPLVVKRKDRIGVVTGVVFC